MGNRFIDATLVVLAVLVFSPVIFAQGAEQSKAAKSTPDLSGVWNPLPQGERHFVMKEPAPMQPWAQERFDYAKNPTIVMGRGRDELEPRYNCFPPGPIGLLLNPRLFEIIQSPRRVILYHEWDHWVRRIWTDGRELPNMEDAEPAWMGYSIGRWDGDTLVVDTIGIKTFTVGYISNWLDRAGTPHSEALRVVERFRRLNHDTLEIEFLFDDPKAFTKPWGGKKVYQLAPPDREILEHIVCEDKRGPRDYGTIGAP